jgi:hypothetical protein
MSRLRLPLTLAPSLFDSQQIMHSALAASSGRAAREVITLAALPLGEMKQAVGLLEPFYSDFRRWHVWQAGQSVHYWGFSRGVPCTPFLSALTQPGIAIRRHEARSAQKRITSPAGVKAVNSRWTVRGDRLHRSGLERRSCHFAFRSLSPVALRRPPPANAIMSIAGDAGERFLPAIVDNRVRFGG